MENSLNLSSSEPTVPSVKSVFKKPTNFYQAFEVSLDESVTATQIQKLEVEEESTSTAPGKVLPFRKTRKSFQQPFNVNPDDSAANSELEQSVSFVKPQPVFAKKNKSLQDFFNVSYNETVESSQPDSFSKTTDESNIENRKQNPFRKTDEPENISVGECSVENSVNKSDESQKRFISSIEEDEADSTTFLTKQNPFKKFAKQKNNSVSRLEITVAEENNSVGDKADEPEIHSTTINSNQGEEPDSSGIKSKLHSFKQTPQQDSRISVMEQRTNSSILSAIFPDPRQSVKNISLEKNIPKPNESVSYLEQSSINDDNLNNWMSDQSENEISVPRVPSITGNTSHVREKEPPTELPNSPEPEENPLSEWEKKFNEIVSNAKNKTQKVGIKLNTQKAPEKRQPFKRAEQMNNDKQNVNKNKPPKLLKPAPFATKKLYEYVIKHLQPKYGIDTVLEAENLILFICDTVKMVTRRKTHQKKLIEDLKKELAKAGLIETTMDFYEFIIKFLPYSFRVKVVPCLQPVTNVVYPPKDVLNPFDKIL